jgi:metallo-beta-lactamase class B
MTRFSIGRAVALATTLATGAVALIGAVGAVPQSANGAVEARVAAAKRAAGTEWAGVFDRVCPEATSTPIPTPRAPASAPAQAAATAPPAPPARSAWHAEPVKVFDNLYFLGQTEYSVWAVTTSAGIILVDTIFDYSVEDEVVGGMKKLGLDPTTIKYAIVSHGHGDHSGGAKFLQDRFGTRIVLSAMDWDLLDRSSGVRPKRDVVATDGMKLTLGDTTLTLYITPGHTLGTLSTLIPVKDNGVPRIAAEWGGTAFNWMGGSPAYITAERPAKFWFQTYIDSARRFRDLASKAGADIVIANHTIFDGSKTKLPAVASRTSGQPNPYVVGKEGVMRYLTVVEECAQAGLIRASQ